MRKEQRANRKNRRRALRKNKEKSNIASKMRRKERAEKLQISFEYHTYTFARLHREMRLLSATDFPEPVERHHFWRLIAPNVYNPSTAQDLLKRYHATLEQSLKSALENQSIAYWYHVYRRLAPGAIGENKSPATIGNTRAILDAAIQKYGRAPLCDRIAFSERITINDVFAGETFGTERKLIERALRHPQLMLTKFRVTELIEFYRLERLAYEIWRTGAMLRITGKGASIRVQDESPYVVDIRSDELHELVVSYDERSHRPITGIHETHSGTVYSNEPGDDAATSIFFELNLSQHEFSFGQHWLNDRGHQVRFQGPLNYLAVPINLRHLLDAHRPLEAAFQDEHGFALDHCLAVIGALGWMPSVIAQSIDPFRILRPEQRGYDGAFQIDRIKELIDVTLEKVAESIGCSEDIESTQVDKVLEWLTLSDENRSLIDLCYPGPHSILIPVEAPNLSEKQSYFVDYVWISRRLRDLFFGIRIDDNNFKGEALEKTTRRTPSPLSHKRLVGSDGTSKQVDASFAVGDRLFIAECRAFSRSIGFEKGQPEAIQLRSEKIDRMLRDIDDKAQWLVRNPTTGTHDISSFVDIVPLAIVPFTEFIPSLFEWYWLRKGVPRVLTPDELNKELSESNSSTEYFHGYRI